MRLADFRRVLFLTETSLNELLTVDGGWRTTERESMYTRRLKMGPMEFALSLESGFGQRIRDSAVYRRAVRPMLHGLSRGTRAVGRSLGWSDRPKEVSLPVRSELDLTSLTPRQRELRERIQGVEWYHCIDLGDGVVTPGVFDLKPCIPFYHLPDRLDGMRVLDAATFNGFWALEFERRGAAEVVAMDLAKVKDLDLPVSVRASKSATELERPLGIGFELVREVLGSKIRREVCNLYDLSPERLGMFDMVFCGDVLLHVMNPMKALQNLRSVTKGFAVIADVYEPTLEESGIYNAMSFIGGHENCVWWATSRMALERMIRDAGFSQVEQLDTFVNRAIGDHVPIPHVIYRATP
jgi:tRNA (mo5U34)-methyltransferase